MRQLADYLLENEASGVRLEPLKVLSKGHQYKAMLFFKVLLPEFERGRMAELIEEWLNEKSRVAGASGD